MIFGYIMGKPRKAVVVDEKQPTAPVASLSLSEDDHGWRLTVTFANGKDPRVIRIRHED